MRKLIIIIGVAMVVVIAAVVFVRHQMQVDDPRYLLRQLRDGSGDSRNLLMRFKLLRADPVDPMIEAFRDDESSSEFRALVAEMLFIRRRDLPDERIDPIMKEALHHPDPIVRRKAADSYAVFTDVDEHVDLIDAIDDEDEQVRRRVYLTLTASGGGPQWGVGQHIDEEQWDHIAQLCRTAMVEEQVEELQFLARSLLGMRIELLLREGRNAEKSGDLVKAQEFLNRAYELDPGHHRTRIRLARHHLVADDREQALAVAEKFGAVLHIPKLTTAPTIDGDPTEEEWAEALTNAEPFYRTTSRYFGRVAEGATKAYIGHHDGQIYVGMLGYEEHLQNLRTKQTNDDSSVWLDDCMELLFDPFLIESNEEEYQIVVNALGITEDIYGRRGNSVDFSFSAMAQIFRKRGYAEFSDAAAAGAFIESVQENPDWDITVGQTVPADGMTRVYYWSVDSAGIDAARARVEELGGTRVSPYWACEIAIDPVSFNDKAKITKDSMWGISIIRTRVGPGAEQTAWWPTFGGSQNPDLFPLAVFEGL